LLASTSSSSVLSNSLSVCSADPTRKLGRRRKGGKEDFHFAFFRGDFFGAAYLPPFLVGAVGTAVVHSLHQTSTTAVSMNLNELETSPANPFFAHILKGPAERPGSYVLSL